MLQVVLVRYRLERGNMGCYDFYYFSLFYNLVLNNIEILRLRVKFAIIIFDDDVCFFSRVLGKDALINVIYFILNFYFILKLVISVRDVTENRDECLANSMIMLSMNVFSLHF